MTYDINQLNRVEPAYLSAFGLTHAPFSLQHDDHFLYLSPELNEQLELLRHYTQYGNLLLIITGERGIGKSSLKQRFIQTAVEEWQICEIQAHTMMDAGLLLRQVATGFGITQPPLDPDSLFEVLSNQIEHLHDQSYEPILIIDDAHELPQDALKSLLYLAEHHSDQQIALRIILFCDPEINTMLDDPAIRSLKERITHDIEISPLSEEQTAEYLRHRLAVAGLDGTSPFTPKLIHKIYQASDGIPAKINEYAHQNLLDDSEPDVSDEEDNTYSVQTTTQYSLKNRLMGGIALIIIVTTLLFQDRINKLFETPDVNPVNKQQETTKLIPPGKQSTEELLSNSDVTSQQKTDIQAKVSVKEKTIDLNLNQPFINKQTENFASSESNKEIGLIKKIENKNINKPKIILNSVNPSPVAASKQRQIISITGEGFNKTQRVNVRWSDNTKLLDENQVNVTSNTFMNLILNVGNKSDTWTVTVLDPLTNDKSNSIKFNVVSNKKENVVTKSFTAPLKTENSNGIQDQNWIKKQAKNNFTLQLLGSHQKNTLAAYLKKFNLKNTAAIFKSKRNGFDWYTLIYGHYPTKAQAQLAEKALPDGMSKPWVRSFSSIQSGLSPGTISKTTKLKMPVIPASSIMQDQEGWLWSQDPSHYSLQLAAGTDKNAIERFIKKHDLTGKAVYFHSIRNGKDWYILVYGSYSGLSNAKQAINQLPAIIQAVKPWARSFGSIHAELN